MNDKQQPIAAKRSAGRWLGQLEKLVKQRTAWTDAVITPFARRRPANRSRRVTTRPTPPPNVAA